MTIDGRDLDVPGVIFIFPNNKRNMTKALLI